ncbi:MAG: hypothetical protein EA347_06125 [Thioalkalivibrio sp.]|nr:MAG: hypothetical protein EA347_06125 [Thioalkalivibrio sp.]
MLLPVGIALLGYLWLSAATHTGSPTWIEQLVLVSPVAFTAYWLLGWSSQAHDPPRRILLGITVLLTLPALVLVFAVEPWQRAEMQRQNAVFSNQAHLDAALERHDCPNGDTLVVAPWLFVTEGEGLRRLVELRIVPSQRRASSQLLVRTTAHGDLAQRQTTADLHQAAAACVGSAGALDALVQRMAEGTFE